jgi:hypothetical protein
MIGPIAAAQLFALICIVGAGVILVLRHTTAKDRAPGEAWDGTDASTSESSAARETSGMER